MRGDLLWDAFRVESLGIRSSVLHYLLHVVRVSWRSLSQNPSSDMRKLDLGKLRMLHRLISGLLRISSKRLTKMVKMS